MSLKLPPYPDYRDSGSRFLGAFPSHWRVERAKVFLREVDERSTTGDEEMLSVSHKTGVTPRREKNVTMFMAESNVGHKLCRPGDVVVNTMWAWMAAAGVSRNYGLVSPSYAVYRPLSNDLFAGRFLDDLLRTPAYRDEYLVRSTGITSSRLRLYPDEFLAIPLALPPLDEQQLITRYLNHLDETIRHYVRAKQSVLDGLRSRRDVITQQAVGGACESVRMGAVVDKIERPIDREPDEVYTPIGVYNRGRGLFHKAPTKGSDLGDSSFFWLAGGDLVLSGQFSWEGAIAMATSDDADCVATHRYAVLRANPARAVSAYLFSYLQTRWGQLLLNHHSRGAAGRNRPLNVAALLKETIPVPELDTQRRIAELAMAEQALAGATRQLIERLLDYRSRVITLVATGRVSVLGAAAGLTDIVATIEPPDFGFADSEDVHEENDPGDAEEAA
jgi:type I restriction enzyme, S subunit